MSEYEVIYLPLSMTIRKWASTRACAADQPPLKLVGCVIRYFLILEQRYVACNCRPEMLNITVDCHVLPSAPKRKDGRSTTRIERTVLNISGRL